MVYKQGTAEWHAARLGKITASRFADVMSNGRGGAISKTAESYMLELVAETYTRRPASEVDTLAMRHGRDTEPEARICYEETMDIAVEQVGFLHHPNNELVGGSPDGLVCGHGLIEIKCPLNPQKHAAVLLSGEMPEEHQYQVQGLLWITGRAWCDFVSYHPHWPETLRLAVVRVPADAATIAEIEARVFASADVLKMRVDRISERWLERLASSTSG